MAVKMRMKRIGALALLALLVFPSFGVLVGAVALTVDTDDEIYAPSDEVEVYGAAVSGENVTILVVFNDTQETIFNVTTLADEDGEYYTRLLLPSDASEGLYNVTASVGEETAETAFTVESPEPPEDVTEVTTEAGQGPVDLKCAIDRAERYKTMVQEAAQNLNDRGFDVAEILTDLGLATTHLETAKDLVVVDPDEASSELAQARVLLGRSYGQLHKIARNEFKEWKAERFLQLVENQIENLEKKINRLQHRLTRGRAAMAALQMIRIRLLKIRERLAADDLDESVNNLETAVQELQGQLEDLDGPATINLLKGIQRLEARIRVLNSTAEWLEKKGEDTTAINEELQVAQTLLNEAMDLLEEGDTGAAQSLLEEASGHIEEAEGKIQGIIRPTAHLNWGRRNRHGEQN